MKNIIRERQSFVGYDMKEIKEYYKKNNIYTLFIDNKGSDLFASMKIRGIKRDQMKQYGSKNPYNKNFKTCKQCNKVKLDIIDNFRRNKITKKILSICIECEEYNNGHNCVKCNKYLLAGFILYTQRENNIYKSAECKKCLYKSLQKINNKIEPEIDDIIKYIEESEDTIIVKEEDFFIIPEEDN